MELDARNMAMIFKAFCDENRIRIFPLHGLPSVEWVFAFSFAVVSKLSANSSYKKYDHQKRFVKIEKHHKSNGFYGVFCQRVTKGRRIEVKVSKSSVSARLDKWELAGSLLPAFDAVVAPATRL